MVLPQSIVGQTPTVIIEQSGDNTIVSLQRLIEKHGMELLRIKNELKLKRESLKDIFDNDAEIAEAKEEVENVSQRLKERKAQMSNDSQIVEIKVDVAELNQQKKEIEETLSNHLVNYHSLTNSMSVDLSDGSEWNFNIKATIKPKQLELFNH